MSTTGCEDFSELINFRFDLVLNQRLRRPIFSSKRRLGSWGQSLIRFGPWTLAFTFLPPPVFLNLICRSSIQLPYKPQIPAPIATPATTGNTGADISPRILAAPPNASEASTVTEPLARASPAAAPNQASKTADPIPTDASVPSSVNLVNSSKYSRIAPTFRQRFWLLILEE